MTNGISLVPVTAHSTGIHGAGVRATQFLTRDGGRIAYDVAGSGPLVVMVPGLGDIRQEYRFLAERLIAEGYRVVTADLRGHGESSVGWASHRPAAVGEDMLALIRAQNQGPAFIVGTSMAGGAAVCAAADAPELVKGLVLIGPFVRDVQPDSAMKRLVQFLMVKIGLAGPWGPRAWGGYIESLYPARKPADFAAYRKALVANLREPGRMAAMKAMIAPGQKTDIAPRIGKVRAPTLVVMGSKDADFPDPAAEAREVAKLTRGEVAMIDGAGHYPQAEMPDETAAIVVAFLAKHR